MEQLKKKPVKFKARQINFNYSNYRDLFIVYKLDTWSQDLNAEFTLKDCLFGAVKFIKNADPYK